MTSRRPRCPSLHSSRSISCVALNGCFPVLDAGALVGVVGTLATLGAGDINQLPVIEGENLRGLVRREDILKWLALQRPVAYAERAE